MKKLICTICPNGCELQVEYNDRDNNYQISGYGCIRGKEFAESEIKHPMRSLQTTVKTAFKQLPMLPVKTDSLIPKEMIFEIMKEAAKVYVTTKVRSGEIVLENVSGTGVNLVSEIDMNLYF